MKREKRWMSIDQNGSNVREKNFILF